MRVGTEVRNERREGERSRMADRMALVTSAFVIGGMDALGTRRTLLMAVAPITYLHPHGHGETEIPRNQKAFFP